MSVTHEHAVEVDTRLSDLWETQQKASMKAGNAFASLHRHLGHKAVWERRQQVYRETSAATEADARAALTDQTDSRFWFTYDGRTRPNHVHAYLTSALTDLDEARATAKAARDEAAPLEAEYATERWPRFFLVLNTGGHIHRSMSCNTTFPTTQWSWLPSLSGLTEDAAVADQGPRLCSVCYPSAPVEWTLGLPKALKPNQCPGSSQQAVDINRRYHTPRGRCAVCGTGVAVSNTGKARPHNTPKGA